MSMNPVPRKIDIESQKLIDKYLQEGGAITTCESKKRSENVEFKGGFYGKKKKKEADE